MNIENPYDPAKFSKYLKDRYFNVKDNTLEESNIDLKEHIENEVLDFIDKHAIQLYYYKDNNYPYRLAQCPDAPLMLYAKGKVEVNPRHI